MEGSASGSGRPLYRFLGVVSVFVLTGLLDRSAISFQVAPGVALVFPAAGVVVAGVLILGWPALVAAFIAYVVTAWGVATTWPLRLAFGFIDSLEGVLPLVVGLPATGSSARRLTRFFLWAVFLNTALSMSLGIPVIVGASPAAESVGTVALMIVSWFFGDMAAVILVAVPLLLVFKPELLLDASDREMMRSFLTRWPIHAALTGVCVLVVAAMELLVPTGAVSCHWLAAFLLIPILLAATRGGAGGGLLVNGLCGIVYLAEVLRLVQPGIHMGLFREVFSTYTNLVMFTTGAVVAGLYAGRLTSMLAELRGQRMALQRSFERVALALAGAIEAKDPTTRGHVQRVARLAVSVGRRLGIEGEQLEMLRYAAILHDVGKIGVPESVLNKESELTDQERSRMERHVDAGVEILQNVDILAPAIPLIRYHQERWDGQKNVRYPGYFGLAGEQIPRESRIIAAVDAYDAMTNDRPYRGALSHEEAVAELSRESGRQFDPEVVEALLEVLEAERLEESSTRWPVVGRGKL